MSDRSNDRRCIRMEMDVLDNNPLLSATAKLSQCVRLRSKCLCCTDCRCGHSMPSAPTIGQTIFGCPI